MNEPVPERFWKRVMREFSVLPVTQGKVSLTFEMNCGTGGTINSMKVKRYIEDEER